MENDLEKIQKVLDYIEENLKRELTADDAISVSGYSVTHGYRIFGSLTGWSIGEYIRLRRLSEAITDYLEHDRKLIDVAFDYGYGSQEAFTRAFKSVFAVTPGFIKLSGIKIQRLLDRVDLFEGGNALLSKEIKRRMKVNIKDEIIDEYSDVVEVTLPEMRVVYYKIISESPEDLSFKTISGWAKRVGLLDIDGTRIFGYNWPDPREGEKLYGYEFCITIPDDWSEDECFPFPIKTLHAGRFGTYKFKFKDMRNAWNKMIGWASRRKGGKYCCSDSDLHWREETFTHKKHYEDFGDTDMILYLPMTENSD